MISGPTAVRGQILDSTPKKSLRLFAMPYLRLLPRLRPILCSMLALGLALPLWAQTTATGTVRGRVLNAVTHEYVRNAEVRVANPAIVVYSTDGGAYTLNGVPAGEATVV